MDFRVLGPLEVLAARDDARPLHLRRGRPRLLLAALLLRAPAAVGADTLIELLWGDDVPTDPSNALQNQVSYLRRTLGASLIATRDGGYGLDADLDDIDARRFEKMVNRGVQLAGGGDVEEAAAAVEAIDGALSLWRGQPFDDLADTPFATGEATRLSELRLVAVEARVDAALMLGCHREVVVELQQLAEAHPLRERFHAQLVLALYRAGRQAEALRAYESARLVLADELGLDPSPELQTIHRRVLEQDPGLLSAPPAAKPAGAGASPQAGAAPFRSVPAPVTELVGRDAELAQVEQLLERNRLLTLTGAGGAGKTRVAIEAASRFRPTEDAWFTDLSAVSDDADVALAVAASVHATTVPAQDPAIAVAESLRSRTGLLVLDTCEHIIDGAASLVSLILRSCPGMRVLATSRRPLDIGGELIWPIPPLALPPPGFVSPARVADYAAVKLFCARASAVRHDFDLTASNAADIAALCHALDGLPLGIELAAAQAHAFSPRSIRTRLEGGQALVAPGGRDAATRQRTLRATLDWSARLLRAPERSFLARLSVFRGSFTLDAAVSVAGDGLDDDPVALLDALARHSLVVVVGEDRYRLLDSVRAYASDTLLQPGEAHLVRRSHAEHYARLAEEADMAIRGPEQEPWLEQLRLEIPNLRAALDLSFASGGDAYVGVRLAGALAWFWSLEGMFFEAERWLDLAVDEAEVPALARAKALLGVGLHAAPLGDLERAQKACELSATIGREAGDDVVAGDALVTLGVTHWALGQFDRAVAAHEEAIERLGRGGDVWTQAVAFVLRARTAVDMHDEAAERLVDRALAAAADVGDKHVLGIAFEQRARLRLVQGLAEDAEAAARESLLLHETLRYPEGVMAALNLLARSAVDLGRPEEAGVLVHRALSVALDHRHPGAMCEALEVAAEVMLASSGPDAADLALDVLGSAAAARTERRLPLRGADTNRVARVRRAAVESLGRDAVDELQGSLPSPLEAATREAMRRMALVGATS